MYWIIFLAVMYVIYLVYEKKSSNDRADYNDVYNKNALFECVDKKDFETFKKLINQDVKFNNKIVSNIRDIDILMYAIVNNCTEIAELLINTHNDIGININKMSFDLYSAKNGVFPLAQAIAFGNEEVVDALLKCSGLNLGLKNRAWAGVEAFAFSAITQCDNKTEISRCIEKVIKDERFLRSDEHYFSLLIEECVINNLNNVITAYIDKIECINHALLINIFIDIIDCFNNPSVEEETKINILKLFDKMCYNDVLFFKNNLKKLIQYDFKNTNFENEIALSNNDIGSEIFHYLVICCFGFKSNKPKCHANDLLYSLICILNDNNVEFAFSYKIFGDKIKQLCINEKYKIVAGGIIQYLIYMDSITKFRFNMVSDNPKKNAERLIKELSNMIEIN